MSSEAVAPKPRASVTPVCLLIGRLDLGGAEKQVVLLAEGLKNRGVDVTVLVRYSGGVREAALRDAGVPVVHLGFARRSAGWRMFAANLKAFARLVGHLRRLRPQVLHAFLYHNYVIAVPAAKLARVPVLVAGRRSLDDMQPGGRVGLAVERFTNRLTDAVITNAEVIAAQVRQRDAVPAGKVYVVYNGLPRSAFAPVGARPLANPPVVLCVANLRECKGHRHLLDAAALLRDRGLPCTLKFAGDGPQRDALLRRAQELGVDARFLGTRTDVDLLLAGATVVALPSLSEGLPNAVIEAMAAGRPVVATRVGGSEELLRGRGLLVPPGDPVALADALALLFTDPANAERLARAARQWCATHLTVESMVDSHLAIYGTLIDPPDHEHS